MQGILKCQLFARAKYRAVLRQSALRGKSTSPGSGVITGASDPICVKVVPVHERFGAVQPGMALLGVLENVLFAALVEQRRLANDTESGGREIGEPIVGVATRRLPTDLLFAPAAVL